MIYQYTTSFDDFKAAQKLGARRSIRSRATYATFHWVLPAIGIVSAGMLVWDIVFRHFMFTPALGGALAGLAWFGLYCPIRQPFLIRKLYKEMLNGRPEEAPLELGVEGQELVSRVPGKSEGRFHRGAIIACVEDESLALLFVAKKKFLIVPKHSLPEAGWLEIKTWLQPGMESTQ
jgi:hypothetical protein